MSLVKRTFLLALIGGQFAAVAGLKQPPSMPNARHFHLGETHDGASRARFKESLCADEARDEIAIRLTSEERPVTLHFFQRK
ncbi:hypothetical protein V8F44DRAFT_608798 [Aspergillus fumigatus]|jgi:hypothetical protein